MRTIILCILIATWAAGAGAVGKQTADPNKGSRVATSSANQQDDSASIWDGDERLSKPITYSAYSEMLCTITDDLQKASGVTFFAGRNASDWRTRELRMNLVVKDLPLKDLMQSIARVMKLRWTRNSGGGKYTYRIIGDKVVTEESPEEKAARELRQRRQTYFSQYMGLARMTPFEVSRLRTTNPSLYELANKPGGMPLAKLLANVPAASMALIDGRELTLRGNDIPLNVANDILFALRSVPSDDAHTGDMTKDAPVSTDALSVTINDKSAVTTQGLGDVEFHLGSDSAIGMHFGDTGASTKATDDSSTDDAASNTSIKAKPAPEPDPVASHPDEPDLHKKIKLGLKTPFAELTAIVSALADASGFAVLSDDYGADSVQMDGLQAEMELKDCLDRITSATGQNWQKRGATIELRDRKWAAKRQKMVQGGDQQEQTDPPALRDDPYPIK